MIWVRMFRFAAPKPLNALTQNVAPWTVLGIGLGICLIVRRRWAWYGLLPVAMAAGILLYQWMTSDAHSGPTSTEVAFAAMAEPLELWRLVVPCALWVLLAWAGIRGTDRALVVLFALAYLLVGLPATIAPQTGERSLYTAYLFSGVAKVLCLWSVPALLRGPPREVGGPGCAKMSQSTADQGATHDHAH